MDDFIRREAAIETLSEFYHHKSEIQHIALREALNRVPTADVRPVVHGHYIGEYDGYADGNPVYDMWYCSECGCCFEDWDEKPTYNFCPNCGADMREVTP